MAKQIDEHEIRRSVWDRLTQPASNHSVGQEAVMPTQQGIRYLQESIQRNLTHLLNSHVYFSLWDPTLEELDASLVNYGLPNYTGTNMGAELDREHLRRSMKLAIRTFEPRLAKVEVEILKSSTDAKHVIHLRIDAEIAGLSDSVPVAFSSDFDPLARKIAVSVSNR